MKQILGIFTTVMLVVLGSADAADVLTYEKAREDVRTFVQNVVERRPGYNGFYDDIATLKDLLSRWENLDSTAEVSGNPKQAVLLELIYRYFGDRTGEPLDVRSIGFALPVYEGLWFPDRGPQQFLPDQKLSNIGTSVRLSYAEGLDRALNNPEELSGSDWAAVAMSLESIFEWFYEGAYLGSLTEAQALRLVKVGARASQELKTHKDAGTLRLQNVTEEIGGSLFDQFTSAFERWLTRAGTSRPELFAPLWDQWLAMMVKRIEEDSDVVVRSLNMSGSTKIQQVERLKSLEQLLRRRDNLGNEAATSETPATQDDHFLTNLPSNVRALLSLPALDPHDLSLTNSKFKFLELQIMRN